MLLQIREYICTHKVVSNQQIARAFQIDTDCLKPMLLRWVDKGVIEKCEAPSGCGQGCLKCQTPPEYYRYVGHHV